MASIPVKNMENISVYNYGSSVVVISTRDRQYTLPPAEAGKPSMIPLTYKEIEYINSNSGAFRNGVLCFADDIKESVYKALGVTNWKDILFNGVTEDIILNPTMEKLQRIVDIKNAALIERVKGILTALKNSGGDISTRVDRIITARYDEISRNKRTTGIVLTAKDAAVKAAAEDIDELRTQNEAMSKELAEMKAMMEQLLANGGVKPEINPSKGE